MKTARFTEVVAAAGAPQVHPLWLQPDKDPALKRAVRDCRVMTIHQALRGTKKDYGSVGLHLEGSTQVLVFPKPLRRFSGRHIVGIDYKLVVQPDPKDPAPPPPPPKKKALPPAPAPAAPKVKTEKKAAPSARAERELHPKALTREELLGEIRKAVRALKAGKAVAAYERLSELIDDE
jgi:hypothetical protein